MTTKFIKEKKQINSIYNETNETKLKTMIKTKTAKYKNKTRIKNIHTKKKCFKIKLLRQMLIVAIIIILMTIIRLLQLIILKII